jgi:HlyD family secretion protein
MTKIKTFFQNLYQNHFKKALLIIIVVILVVWKIFSGNSVTIAIGELKTGTLREVVTVSGSVEPSQDSFLSFEKAGKIDKINVSVGDRVVTGQVLANLSNGSDYAAVLSAKANLSQAEANLEDVKNGPSESDLRLKEDTVSAAKTNLSNANLAVQDTLRSVNASLNDLVRNKLGSFFTNSSGFYRLNYNGCDQNFSSQIELERKSIDKNISDLSTLSTNFVLTQDDNTDNQNIDQAQNLASLSAKNVSNLIDDISSLLTYPCAISDTSLDSQRSVISSIKSTISTTISSINTSKTQITNYRNAYSSSLLSLNQLKAGASSERIKSLSAQVESARASLLSAESNNNKNYLIAPFSGVVTEVNLNLGEISSPNIPAIKMISDGNFEIKAKLTEIDVVKVKTGNTVKITLDTYGDSVEFDGVVSQVDPAATTVNGVSNYYAKINFLNNDPRIKSGMNASAEINTNTKENTNYVSNKFVLIKNGVATVKVIKDISKIKKTTTSDTDPNIEIRKIDIGIRGADGEIEVLSGITSSDKLFGVGIEILTATSTK